MPESVLPSKSRANTKWVLPTVAAVLVIAIGLLVWKFVFAPKTYTDPQYGYSFSHPASWEVFADNSMLPLIAAPMEGAENASIVMIGNSSDSNADEVAMLGVVRADLPVDVDRSQIAAELQYEFDQIAATQPGISVIEPVYPTTVGGVDGWKVTLSYGVGPVSMTMSSCILLDGNTTYLLVAAATGDAWDNNRKTFERFFDSFKPG